VNSPPFNQAPGRFFDPASLLFNYQRDWANDKSRWKFGLMSRQVGKDFSAAFEGIRDIMAGEKLRQKRDWLIVAPSERQSLESLQKWEQWAGALKFSLRGFLAVRQSGPEGLLKSASITFPGGSRVIAVPGKPDTVRGYSANVLLTEFAFFEDPDATWRAILPSITNPMRGGVKKVRLITTPNGITNKAHDIWVKNYRGQKTSASSVEPPEDLGEIGRAAKSQNSELQPLAFSLHPSQWSCHLVDIHRAVAQGLPVNIEELKAALDDPEGWAQEFECQFLDTQSVLLP
jgi:phage FluMu gp28-like protein